MKTIPLTQGKYAIVDDEDYEFITSQGFKWSAHWEKRVWYAVGGQHPQKRMHTLLTGFTRTDHINHNGLDNRRINLREANFQQNSANQRLSRNNTSGHKGVIKVGNKYLARIWFNGTQTHLGTFDYLDDAIAARLAAEQTLFGEYRFGQ
jgi:hypothetical protein